ncbi:hypothetical protein K503DRAFT_28372 [Rhizopogon vinicolor AM-OR11-026]|uniref:Heterokaryon incompatibility domain-containing protein n=1 Tax=Rhizopogon vinicolor AM-OR11-026 TaxID=1314800 RepID=A0A1B7N5H6_9AGAM|nr:hypothetical protein K503DRAFT_28372 [Rhizopogon vinicolor AM-OR11-026]
MYFGYELERAALHGAGRYDEASEAFKTMLSKLDEGPDAQIRSKDRITYALKSLTPSPELRQQYLTPSEAEDAILKAINGQLENAPLRLLHTRTGRLCDRAAQIHEFTTSPKYKKLLSLTMKHADLQTDHITEVVGKYFRCVMLSHRWEGSSKEPQLHDIQDKTVYNLNNPLQVGGIIKLQSFCTVARGIGFRWAWIDTCCIDQNSNVELQKSLNSMFVWYRHSALTIVYLSDVPPSSNPGALARSVWNTRGWTVPEFLAPKVILFYQNDWTPYLDDRSSNHKQSRAIMQELEDATGIDLGALITFTPGVTDAREKLRWASTRITTLQEDIAYSLFGIFSVHLPIIYGERRQNALGRLLEEIVAQSGDISALDWVGRSSEFNSCLPADITAYENPPFTQSSLSEEEMQTTISSLRDSAPGVVELALSLYSILEYYKAPRFAHRRLHLPCIPFTVTEIRRRPQSQETYPTYEIKADGLRDMEITTEDRLIQFSRTRPIRQTFLLVRPWNRHLLEMPDFTDQSVEESSSLPGPDIYDSPHETHGETEPPVDLESHSRALRLIVRLGRPFGAFLLAQQRGGEYKRVAADHDIIAEVRDKTSVRSMMGIKTLEIL